MSMKMQADIMALQREMAELKAQMAELRNPVEKRLHEIVERDFTKALMRSLKEIFSRDR